jgi:hypothetical protein
MERIPGGPDRFRAFAFDLREVAPRPVGQLTSVSAYVKIRGRRPSGLVFGVWMCERKGACFPHSRALSEVEPLDSFREIAVRRSQSRCESGPV